MAEILVKFDEPITAPDGETFFAQAVGKEVQGGLWEGWLEFVSVSDTEDALGSGRETTQPNRTNLEYWAQGLTKVYLEGALARAIWLAEPPSEPPVTEMESPRFTSPVRRGTAPAPVGPPFAPRPILDPFEVYAQGEEVLRGELNALSRDHLEAIVTAYGFAPAKTSSGIKPPSNADLIETIIGEARGNRPNAKPDSGESRAQL